jgi:hypothetical protein
MTIIKLSVKCPTKALRVLRKFFVYSLSLWEIMRKNTRNITLV